MELSKEDPHNAGQLQGRENIAVSESTDDRPISSKSTNYLYSKQREQLEYRGSHALQLQKRGFYAAGDSSLQKCRFVLAVDKTKEALLLAEDSNGDGLITVDDCGPKAFTPNTLRSDGNQDIQVKGTYALAILLQELFLAQKKGETHLELDYEELNENPVHRLERLIKGSFWDNLTRHIDASGIFLAAKDPKTVVSQPRIYVPTGVPEQHAYYLKLAQERPEMDLDVQWLPEGEITPEFIKSLNSKPGILALEMEEDYLTEGKELKGLPFIVPGGRFNELYNWDSCFCALGMLDTHPHVVKSMLRHFIFEIKHYRKVLNANRSYYLGRSQPPLMTDLALRTYKATIHEPGSKDLLRDAILAAIREYHDYWMTPPRYDKASGLTRYRPIGLGFPPECEDTQFAHILAPYAKKNKMTIEEITQAYNDGEINEPGLDIFCLHDRALRESGHDTSNRLEGRCADLATIDLNCLLYRYERDIADTIRTIFDDCLVVPAAFCGRDQEPDHLETSASWEYAAHRRRQLIDKHMWNEEKGLYFDYDTESKQQSNFETVTSLWALWCGAASPHQAALLVKMGLPKFECVGGLSTGTEQSRGPINAKNPQKQWDYPYGWAPHQILAWHGLKSYGYQEEAERLIYRWLHMITKVFVDYNGTVVEKYDVTQLESPHKVTAEYGNQGLDFKYTPQEGFGWTNASYVHGLSLLSVHAKRALGECTGYEEYAKAAKWA